MEGEQVVCCLCARVRVVHKWRRYAESLPLFLCCCDAWVVAIARRFCQRVKQKATAAVAVQKQTPIPHVQHDVVSRLNVYFPVSVSV